MKEQVSKKYQQKRSKIWISVKLKRETVYALKSLEGELQLHTYDDVINALMEATK